MTVAEVLMIGAQGLSAIFFMRWLARCNRNLRALGAEGLQFTPFTAWVFCFVPIMFLWKPYQAVREIWKASGNLHDWKQAASTPLLPAWFGSWIAGIMMVKMSDAAIEHVKTVEELVREIDFIAIAKTSMLTGAAATMLLVHLVRTNLRKQARLAGLEGTPAS